MHLSGVYPYCVVSAGRHPPAGLTGIGGRPVRGYDVGPFTVWASEEEVAPPVDLEGISTHHGVVSAAVAATTALPVRFGSWAPSTAVLATRIEENRENLEAALASAAGRIEMGVAVDDAGVVPAQPVPTRVSGAYTDGRAYLRALSESYSLRHERRTKQEAVAAEIGRRLEALTHEVRVRYTDPPSLISVAHLIGREDEGRYRSLLADLAASRDYAGRMHVTGPWPPYSFASSASIT
jgi:hypothetical protein